MSLVGTRLLSIQTRFRRQLSTNAQKTAVVLLSGGIDSATTLAVAKSEGYRLHALSFDYGQRHRFELECATKIANSVGVEEHRWLKLNLRAIGGSALTSDTIPVPKNRGWESQARGEIPVTYVPGRNTIFLSYALAYAEVIGSNDIFIGANAMDYSGYPDCRPAYIEAFQAMARLATKAGAEGKSTLTIRAPLISDPKTEIIRKGMALGVDFALTSSCYDPGYEGKPCEQCDSCKIRITAFRKLRMEDPVVARFRPTPLWLRAAHSMGE
mmetsp:Transcript_40780/g.66136  ORF Transcript_40780/g.66136 Transcript_40780/m.66136 type:complete len:269 (-) Transcript_40780:671-1477(-)